MGAGDVTLLGKSWWPPGKQSVDGDPDDRSTRLSSSETRPLAPLTSIRVGGPADRLAGSGRSRGLGSLAWARDEGVPVAIVRRGSNLLVADAGFRGLAVRLVGRRGGDLRSRRRRVVRRQGPRCRAPCSGPPPRASRASSGAPTHPGTAGGAVAMNAGARAGELAQVLRWAVVCSSDRRRQVGPGELALGYRRSAIGPGDVVAAVAFALRPGDGEDHRLAAGRLPAGSGAQPSLGVRTPAASSRTRPATRAGRLLEAAGCKGLESRRRAVSSPVRELHPEAEPGTRAADVLALMAEVAGASRPRTA